VLGVVGGFGGEVYVPSLLALAAGVACLAEGTVVYKLFPASDPVATNAISMTMGVPLFMVLSLLTGEQWGLPTNPSSWAGFGYLVVVGSIGVFYLYLIVLTRWTASATAYSFLFIPISTVIISALVVGETITISFLAGGVAVLVGVWLGAIRKSLEKTAELMCSEVPNKAVC
jgi:drug/metabolite transporter (DMT)-like permease